MTCRVMLVTTDSKICGTESMILSLLKYLNRELYSPYLVTLTGQGDLIEAARNLGVDGQNLALSRRQLLTGFFRFRKILKDFQPHVIHSFLFHSNLFARAARFFNREISVISGIRTVYTVKDYGRFYGWMERLTHPLDVFYVANSQHGLQSVIQGIGLGKEKLVLIHNGLELAETSESIDDIRGDVHFEFDFDERDYVIGIVAQLRKPKRHDLLIHAIARLKDRYPLRLLIVGQGEMESDLRALAIRLGVEKQIVFTGYRSDVNRLLWGMDIFALPSEVEGQPVSVLEAMNAGLPVVAARAGGIPEVVAAGETGLLCEPGSLDDLCQALSRLLESGDLRARMGKASQTRVQKLFSAERMARRFEGLYERCMKAKKGKTE